MLKTRFLGWTFVLALIVVGGLFITHGPDGLGGFGFDTPFINGQNDRPHKINSMKDHDGGVVRVLVIWRGIKPQSASLGVSSQPERLGGDQIPNNPTRIQRTYTYHSGQEYVAQAAQSEPTFEGPLDCEITIDGIHADGDHLSHGKGKVHCWVLPA